MVQDNEGRVQEGREERSEKNAAETKNGDVAQAVQSNWPPDKGAGATCADERFAGVADEPANNHTRGDITLELGQPMSWKRRQQHDPPDADRRQEKCREQYRVGWPKNRNRMWLESEGEPKLRAEIITREDQETDLDGGRSETNP